MFIRTERLFLRPGWPEDIDELLGHLRDGSVARGLVLPAQPLSPAGLREFLAHPRRGVLPYFFIDLREKGESHLIGGIGLARSGPDVELAYWLASAYRKRGYAAEAVTAVLAQARTLGHSQIISGHFADDRAPAGVMERAGFKPTGETQLRPSLSRGGLAPVRLYAAALADKLYDLMGAQPLVAGALRSSQRGARSGVMSSIRKWSTASPSAG